MSNQEEIKDPFCDEANPVQVPFEQISAAAYRIKSGIVRTPCDRSHMSDDTGMQIFLKKDYMQYTGSFKERGARYTLTMLDEGQKKRGVISASAGNHAQAMAYHGGLLGIPVTVVMPVIAPIMKIENCKKYGASVIIHGQHIGECREYALRIAQQKGLMYVNGFDHPHILAGQGTMGLEILEQVPDVDAVVIPVGGGGMLAGCAVALKTMKPEIKIIGVEAELCPSFTEALKAGRPVKTKTAPTLADGLAVPTVGSNALATAAPLVDKMVTVSEEWIAISILRLIEMEKAVVEGGGASGVAAVLAGLVPELKGKKVVIPLCGGNIDTTILGRCIDRGLAADGRLVKFTVTVSDRPGGIAELAKTLTNTGASVKDMMHERAWIKNDIFSVEVKVLAETRNRTHTREMFHELLKHYGDSILIEGTEEDVLKEDMARMMINKQHKEHYVLRHMDSRLDLRQGKIHGAFSSLQDSTRRPTDSTMSSNSTVTSDEDSEVDEEEAEDSGILVKSSNRQKMISPLAKPTVTISEDGGNTKKLTFRTKLVR